MKSMIVAALFATATAFANAQSVCFGANCGNETDIDTMVDFYSLMGKMRTNQMLAAYGIISVDEPTETPKDACYSKCDNDLTSDLNYCKERYTIGSAGSQENLMANNCMQGAAERHKQCLAPMMMNCE